MVKVNEAFKIKLKKDGENFELLIDFEKLNEFRKNQNCCEIEEILADLKIFKDEKKGEVVSKESLDKAFPKKNEKEIIKTILLEGDVQIPSSYLNKLREEKKNKL